MNMDEIKQSIAKIDASILKGNNIIQGVTKEVQQLILNKQELIGYGNALNDVEKLAKKPAVKKIAKK